MPQPKRKPTYTWRGQSLKLPADATWKDPYGPYNKLLHRVQAAGGNLIPSDVAPDVYDLGYTEYGESPKSVSAISAMLNFILPHLQGVGRSKYQQDVEQKLKKLEEGLPKDGLERLKKKKDRRID